MRVNTSEEPDRQKKDSRGGSSERPACCLSSPGGPGRAKDGRTYRMMRDVSGMRGMEKYTSKTCADDEWRAGKTVATEKGKRLRRETGSHKETNRRSDRGIFRPDAKKLKQICLITFGLTICMCAEIANIPRPNLIFSTRAGIPCFVGNVSVALWGVQCCSDFGSFVLLTPLRHLCQLSVRRKNYSCHSRVVMEANFYFILARLLVCCSKQLLPTDRPSGETDGLGPTSHRCYGFKHVGRTNGGNFLHCVVAGAHLKST